MRDAVGVIHQLLQSSPCFRTPQTQGGDLLGLVDKLHLGEAHLVDHALHPHIVAMAGVTAADHAEAVLGQAHNREIRMDTAGAVEEVGVNTFTDRRVGTDLGH